MSLASHRAGLLLLEPLPSGQTVLILSKPIDFPEGGVELVGFLLVKHTRRSAMLPFDSSKTVFLTFVVLGAISQWELHLMVQLNHVLGCSGRLMVGRVQFVERNVL